MKRSRIKPVSDKRRAGAPERALVRAAVFQRDRVCRLHLIGASAGAGCCFGARATPHHLRKAGAGGTYTLDNLVQLCAGHNDWVETDHVRARELGLELVTGDDPAHAWRTMHALGIGREGDPFIDDESET